jgi:cytidylate kinase
MVARVIAIDGPAGSGKSTVARGVARALGLHTLDTGAMYRAVTLAALEARVSLDNGDALAALAGNTAVEATDGAVHLDGRDVSREVRDPDITTAVSEVSAHPAVRAVMVEQQRGWIAHHGGGVVEGRDIGTVVLPEAPVKVFLTARDDVRARRRHGDEASAARDVDVTAVQKAIAARDQADATLGRALRPEQAAADAVVIDTTDREADDVIAEVVLLAESVA